MDGVTGKTLGTWDGFFDSKITAKKEVGKGFANKDEAVEAARQNKGAEAILQDKDGSYHVFEIDDGSRYAFTKANIEQVKDYPVSNIVVDPGEVEFKVVSMVTEDDHEFVGPAVHRNPASGNNLVVNDKNTKGPPVWGMAKWPSGSEVTPAQEARAIKQYAAMVIQQFRYDHGRDPNPKELVKALVQHSDKLPYKSTNDLDGKARIAASPLTIFGHENSSSVVFQTGTGRCGDLADLHYKFAMEAARQLGKEKEMQDGLFIIGVEGIGGANVNHAALGFIDPPQTIQNIDKTNLSMATVIDPWMRASGEQNATQWGTEYCFDITKHPLLAVRNIMGPFVHGFDTTVTDSRYRMMAFTPDYSMNQEFTYDLRE